MPVQPSSPRPGTISNAYARILVCSDAMNRQNLARQIGQKPVLIPAADQFVSAIGAHVDELKDHFIFLPEAFVIQAQLATKEQQYALAEAHGLPTPRTQFIRSGAELKEFARA